MPDAMSYLDSLQDRARAAESEEAAYRREAARRIAGLEGARTAAFRRYHLVKDVLAAMRPHPEEEAAAVTAAQAHLADRFGWASADERAAPVLEAFAPVAAALHRDCDQAEAMAAFEAWFEARSGRSFWSLQDEPAVITPLVDF